MNITQTSSLFNSISNSYRQTVNDVKQKPWAAMTTTEKFLHIITVGIWSPSISQEEKAVFEKFLNEIASSACQNNDGKASAFYYNLEVEYNSEQRSFCFLDSSEQHHDLNCPPDLDQFIYKKMVKIINKNENEVIGTEVKKKKASDLSALTQLIIPLKATDQNVNVTEQVTSTEQSKATVTTSSNALDLFFQKLESWLIDSNTLSPLDPNTEWDVLPEELNKLKQFILQRQVNNEHVLHRSENLQYCFTWQPSKDAEMRNAYIPYDLYVKFMYKSPTRTNEWQSSMPQKCDPKSLLSTFVNVPNSIQKSPCLPEDLFNEQTQYVNYALFKRWEDNPVEDVKGTLSITDRTIAGINKTIKSAIDNAKSKPLQYLLYDCPTTTKIFNTVFNDLSRSKDNDFYFNEVKIDHDTLCSIIDSVTISTKGDGGNPLAWNPDTIIDQMKKNSTYNEMQIKAVSQVLKKPQFPSALLAVTAQALAMLTPLNLLILPSNNLLYLFCRENNLALQELKLEFRDTHSYDIKLGKDDNLNCTYQYTLPYMDYLNNDYKIGALITYSSFPVSKELIRPDSASKNEQDTEKYLDSLNKNLCPLIQTGVVYGKASS